MDQSSPILSSSLIPPSSSWRLASWQEGKGLRFWLSPFYIIIFTLSKSSAGLGLLRNWHQDWVTCRRHLLGEMSVKARGNWAGKDRENLQIMMSLDTWEGDGEWRDWVWRVSDYSTLQGEMGPGQLRECLTRSCSSKESCISPEWAYISTHSVPSHWVHPTGSLAGGGGSGGAQAGGGVFSQLCSLWHDLWLAHDLHTLSSSIFSDAYTFFYLRGL